MKVLAVFFSLIPEAIPIIRKLSPIKTMNDVRNLKNVESNIYLEIIENFSNF